MVVTAFQILQAIYAQLNRKCVCQKSSISGIFWWSYANNS